MPDEIRASKVASSYGFTVLRLNGRTEILCGPTFRAPVQTDGTGAADQHLQQERCYFAGAGSSATSRMDMFSSSN